MVAWGKGEYMGRRVFFVQEATPTVRWPIPELLPMPMLFMSFLAISLLLLRAPTFCFLSTLWLFVTLWVSDTRCLCKLVSFSFPRSFLPVTSFLVVASGGKLWLVYAVCKISLPPECSVNGKLVSSEASSGSDVSTDSLVEGAWSFPALKYDFDPATALLPGLVDLFRALLTLLVLNTT